MKILLHIFDSIFAIFTDPKIDLSKQLIRLQVESYFVSSVQSLWYSFPSWLTLSWLATNDSRLLSCMYFEAKKRRRQFYLYQLGTDQLERLFGNIRTITHAWNCDLLELCQ